MAILICVQNLAGTGLGVAPRNYFLEQMPALQECIPCAILMKLLGFVGTSMPDLNSQFDCICLRGLDFIGFYFWGVCFHKYFSVV